MKKFKRTKARGREGNAFVEGVISEAGSIFREISEATDVGIDGHVEFVYNEIATGTLVGVQIKCGPSYTKHSKGVHAFTVTLTNEDINYLYTHQLPVAIIFYDPVTQASGWLDVSQHIRKNKEILEQNNVTLTLEFGRQPFNTESFEKEFKPAFSHYKIEIDQLYALELFASQGPDDKYQGFVGLMSEKASRFTKSTCFMLINHLFCPDNNIRALVSDALSRYLSHPEAGFVPPPNIRQYVELALQRFGLSEIAGLLETAWYDEENLMQRGSIGQSVGVLITAIPNHSIHLYTLAVDKQVSEKIRQAALMLAHEFTIEDTVILVAQNIELFLGGELEEDAIWVAELAAEIQQLEIEQLEPDFLRFITPDEYNDDYFAVLLRAASLLYLAENENTLYTLLFETNNSYVRFEIGRTLTKIMKIKENPNFGLPTINSTLFTQALPL